MIRNVHVRNYKSLANVDLELGRVTVLIGENGSGKSNILEAVALASAAAQYKLDNEYLASRGIRVTETRFMRSAFSASPPPANVIQLSFNKEKQLSVEPGQVSLDSISVSIQGDDDVAFHSELWADETASYPKWKQVPPISVGRLKEGLEAADLNPEMHMTPEVLSRIIAEIAERLRTLPVGTLPGFLVYAPENSSLRTFQAEGQILPLGIRGEGLFAHLVGLNSDTNRVRLAKIGDELKLLNWFERFEVPQDLGPGERVIRIQDQFLQHGSLFDQRSANEGFLFLLFYMTLFISPDTPAFFSIKNIDTCLNPKLCITLLNRIVALAKEHDKQVILTTHNPAILDGLDLSDEEQRLLVVERGKVGHTRIHRVNPAMPSNGKTTVSLSEAFMRGYIGGLPKNF